MKNRKLYDELIELNIMALYDFMCPIEWGSFTADQINNRRRSAIDRYRNDSVFHTRIDALMAATIKILDKNID